MGQASHVLVASKARVSRIQTAVAGNTRSPPLSSWRQRTGTLSRLREQHLVIGGKVVLHVPLELLPTLDLSRMHYVKHPFSPPLQLAAVFSLVGIENIASASSNTCPASTESVLQPLKTGQLGYVNHESDMQMQCTVITSDLDLAQMRTEHAKQVNIGPTLIVEEQIACMHGSPHVNAAMVLSIAVSQAVSRRQLHPLPANKAPAQMRLHFGLDSCALGKQ